jgi:hypothetical protein
MNRIKHQDENIPEPKMPKAEKTGSSATRKFISAINVFSYFDRKSIIYFMPYVFFLTGCAVVYIANSYLAERTIRDIDKTERDIKELRSEFITGKSELMYRSKLSEVASAIESKGLKESTMAPKKILLRKSTRSTEQ